MNRLFIVGNGFDLAHGLPTSYTDFIRWYFTTAFITCFKDPENGYHDGLISVSLKPNYSNNVKVEYIEYFVKVCMMQTDWFTITKHNVYDFIENKMLNNIFIVNIGDGLLKKLMVSGSMKGWVDIENDYYNLLIDCADEHVSEVRLKGARDLNNGLYKITRLLKEYLDSLPVAKTIEEYESLFRVGSYKERGGVPVDSTLILNFNYTDTFDLYYKTLAALNTGKNIRRFEMLQIHGSTEDITNPIIFGCGDDLHARYSQIENLNENEFLRNIKSFKYLRTPNYNKLIRFIDTRRFEVQIVGHSCGLSDRTMLNMIFEHPNASHIKVSYYQKDGLDNYTEITQEISRHFITKKIDFRRRLIWKGECEPMPQANVNE